MDPIEPIFQFVYNLFFVPPNIKIKIYNVLNIPRWVIVTGMFISYFVFTAGVVYDAINSPPSMGVIRDPHTGRQIPQAVMAGRINGQYVIEGFSASFMFCMGAIGFILANASITMDLTKKTRMTFFGAGVTGVLISYNVLISFLKLKVPNYLMR